MNRLALALCLIGLILSVFTTLLIWRLKRSEALKDSDSEIADACWSGWDLDQAETPSPVRNRVPFGTTPKPLAGGEG